MSEAGVLDHILAGFEAIGDDPRIVAMWIIALALLYVGVAKRKEPLLLVPISMGILFANLPLGEFIRAGGEGEPTGILRTFQTVGLESDIFPLLIFLGVGTATDFSPMLSNPKTLLLGAGAQAGVFFALIGALVLGALGWFEFGLLEAASIGIIGGADGPTTIFIATRMRELGESLPHVEVRDIVGATAVAAYSYMALVPIIQPPLIKLLTTQNERRIRMEYSSEPVSRRVFDTFPNHHDDRGQRFGAVGFPVDRNVDVGQPHQGVWRGSAPRRCVGELLDECHYRDSGFIGGRYDARVDFLAA